MRAGYMCAAGSRGGQRAELWEGAAWAVIGRATGPGGGRGRGLTGTTAGAVLIFQQHHR